MRVAIVGASGETGRSIANALLQSDTKFVSALILNSKVPEFWPNVAFQEVLSLIREASRTKRINIELESQGLKLISVDLNGPEEELAAVLSGVDVVISTIDAGLLSAQIVLANAAKLAGVGRFIPCSFGTIAPPNGVMELRDEVYSTTILDCELHY